MRQLGRSQICGWKPEVTAALSGVESRRVLGEMMRRRRRSGADEADGIAAEDGRKRTKV